MSAEIFNSKGILTLKFFKSAIDILYTIYRIITTKKAWLVIIYYLECIMTIRYVTSERRINLNDPMFAGLFLGYCEGFASLQHLPVEGEKV